MAAQNQQEIFEEAKQSIASELDEETLAWNFSQMLSQWSAVMAEKSLRENGTTRTAIRSFCRHYLDMHGESFMEARRWLSGAAVMPFEKIQLVLRVLKSSREGTLVSETSRGGTNKPTVFSEDNSPRWPEATAPKTSGLIRKVIDHTTTLFNSLMILVIEAGVNANDLFDGDRIQIRITLKHICDAFGIDVIFPEPEAARNRPVTQQDFANLGLKPPTQRKRRRS